MKIDGNEIVGTNIVGEVKVADALPNMDLVTEVEALMKKYKINYMWFAWDHFGGTVRQLIKKARGSSQEGLSDA